VTYCDIEVRGGAIGALDTDACGNLYVADDLSEAIWRFGPDGRSVQRVATLHRGALTGMTFGPRIGGGEADVLYVSGRGGADLISVPVGLPGRARVRPRAGAAPVAPAPDPRTTSCLDLPPHPVAITELDRPRGYHGLAFDQEGWVIGFDGTALVRVNRQEQLQPYALGLTAVEGMDWLPDGSLVVACAEGLVRIAPNGSQEVLAANVYAYSVTVGPRGRVWAGDNAGRLWRLDPDEGVLEAVLDVREGMRSFAPRAVAFDVDASLLYIVSFGETLYTLALDDAYDPIGPPRYFATVQRGVRWVDGLAVDRCGNLYVPNYETSALFRVRPDGQLALYHQWSYEHYGHGAVWGNGIGGWLTDALYLPQPYDGSTVVEVVVGVHGAGWSPPDPE